MFEAKVVFNYLTTIVTQMLYGNLHEPEGELILNDVYGFTDVVVDGMSDTTKEHLIERFGRTMAIENYEDEFKHTYGAD